MTNATLRNTDIDAALNEAKEAYVTSAPPASPATSRQPR